MMFATRAHVVRLANMGLARLDFAWRVLHANGAEDTSGAAWTTGQLHWLQPLLRNSVHFEHLRVYAWAFMIC